MERPAYFSLRRLSPFRGTIQVVEVSEARAFSLDGLGWTIQLLSQRPIRETVWGNIGPVKSERRYFTFGRRSDEGKLVRVPIDPSLGDQSGHAALDPLLIAIDTRPELPFSAVDHLELWLLDRKEGLPLALLQSTRDTDIPAIAPPAKWLALPFDEGSFHSPGLMVHAPDDKTTHDRRQHRAVLERLVAGRAGQPARLQWFQRDADGRGEAVTGENLDRIQEERKLGREAFPELLLRDEWSAARDSALVHDYLEWQAPLLLTLPSLARDTRERLEKAARRRATVLYQYRRLIPEVVNWDVVKPALVEAVIRLTA